jgi:hypothetical protein
MEIKSDNAITFLYVLISTKETAQAIKVYRKAPTLASVSALILIIHCMGKEV